MRWLGRGSSRLPFLTALSSMRVSYGGDTVVLTTSGPRRTATRPRSCVRARSPRCVFFGRFRPASRAAPASTATATASAAPRVVLCVADGIVRIVVHVAAGEDLGRRLRRGIDRLIGVTAGERERCGGEDAEPQVGRSFGRCAGEVGHHTLRRRGWRSH
jgi:hypothetical protein